MRKTADEFLSRIAGEYGNPDDPVGIKVHFGDEGNVTHLSPEWLKGLPSIFKHPVFIECNVLYKSKRSKRETHIALAKEHGFGFLPIDILDGAVGDNKIEVEIDTKNTKRAKLGAGISKYKKCIAITHFKGHMAAGFGGALKNIGMGLGSRAGKLDMHASVSPRVNTKACIACSACAKDCPVKAISVGEFAIIDSKKCIGCAHCIGVCPTGAMTIPWGASPVERLMEKIAEYSLALSKGREWRFINFLTNITPECDCMAGKQVPMMKDIGVLYSSDPVAIDQASADLAITQYGKDPFKEHHKINWEHTLKYAEEIGLGSRKYELVKV